MLKLLSYNHLFTYGLLFVFTVAVRLPSFHTNYFEQDEAFYLTAGQKIVDGGVQYVDTWDNKPPVLSWFYALFVAAFGSYAIVAIRIFTCIYLYISALLFNQFVTDNKLLERFSMLPAFLLVFLCSVPWYAQELNGEILLNLPIILAVFQLLRLQERARDNNSHLFFAGLLLGLAFMIKYQAVLLFFGMFAAYLTIYTPRLSETFSMFSGFALTVVLLLAGVYATGAMEEFWDIGVVYNLDYIFLGRNPGEESSLVFNLGQYVQLWGIFLLLALIGVVHFRLNYFTNTIRLRKIELLLLFWLVASLFTVILGGSRLYLHYFYVMVPPLSLYVAKFFEMKIRGWVRNLALLVALIVPMYTFGVFFASAFPKTFSFLDEDIRPGGWIDSFRKRLNEPLALEAYIDRDKVHNGILVMDYEPVIYARMALPCATRYTNFSMAYYKLAPFRSLTGQSLISHTESDADIYRAFRDEMPEYIVDPLDIFPLLRSQLPLLFAGYQSRTVTDGSRNYKVYSRL